MYYFVSYVTLQCWYGVSFFSSSHSFLPPSNEITIQENLKTFSCAVRTACWRGTDFLDNHSSTKEAFTSNTEKMENFPCRETQTHLMASWTLVCISTTPELDTQAAVLPPHFFILYNSKCQGMSCRSWMTAEQIRPGYSWTSLQRLPAASDPGICHTKGRAELKVLQAPEMETDPGSSRTRNW